QDGAEERAKRDGVPYLQWIADGTMTATPGNVTDYAFVKADIMEIAETYKPISIAYDRFNASQLVIELQDEGLKMEPYGQGFVSMSAPTRQIEKMVLSRELGHGGNEPLRWMCGNIQVKMDPAGNIKMDKAKSREKIDGMVSWLWP
ncbi:MAG: terminase large subunit, partial [Saprospirales bacterium]|nr:terminase large subunit [Saprospirales bacterium]